MPFFVRLWIDSGTSWANVDKGQLPLVLAPMSLPPPTTLPPVGSFGAVLRSHRPSQRQFRTFSDESSKQCYFSGRAKKKGGRIKTILVHFETITMVPSKNHWFNVLHIFVSWSFCPHYFQDERSPLSVRRTEAVDKQHACEYKCVSWDLMPPLLSDWDTM